MNAYSFTQATSEALSQHDILKDVLHDPQFKAWGVLAAEYSKDAPVAMGNTLSVEKTQLKPVIQFTLNQRKNRQRFMIKICSL